MDCRDRGFYSLHQFVIMPEHLHMLITPGSETSLEKAMMMIKGGSSHKIKQQLLYKFPIWMEGFHDRWIRDQHEYRIRKQYIDQNPVKAHLVDKPSEYQLGSSCGMFRLDFCKFDEGASGAEAPRSAAI